MEPPPLKLTETVTLDGRDRAAGLYMLGKPGFGKSTLLLDLICQDLDARMGLCVLDPHGDLVDDVLLRYPIQRVGDLVLLDASDYGRPFGLNIFGCPDPNDDLAVDKTLDVVVQTFKKCFDTHWGYQMENIIRKVTLVFIANPGTTMADFRPFLENSSHRRRLLAKVDDEDLRDYWERYDQLSEKQQGLVPGIGSTLVRVGAFMEKRIVKRIVSRQNSVDLGWAMDTGKVVLVKLPVDLGEDGQQLLGTTIVGQIVSAAFARSRQATQDRRPFGLYVDECHLFTSDFFSTILTGTRKYGLLPVVAHQGRDQFKGSSMVQAVLKARTMCFFQLDSVDAGAMAREIALPAKPEIPDDVIGTLLRDGCRFSYDQDWVDSEVRPLFDFLRQHTRAGRVITRTVTTTRESSNVTPENLRFGIQLLNEYWRDCMRGLLDPVSQDGCRRAVEVGNVLRGWLHIGTEGDWPGYDSDFQKNNGFSPELKRTLTDLLYDHLDRIKGTRHGDKGLVEPSLRTCAPYEKEIEKIAWHIVMRGQHLTSRPVPSWSAYGSSDMNQLSNGAVANRLVTLDELHFLAKLHGQRFARELVVRERRPVRNDQDALTVFRDMSRERYIRFEPTPEQVRADVPIDFQPSPTRSRRVE